MSQQMLLTAALASTAMAPLDHACSRQAMSLHDTWQPQDTTVHCFTCRQARVQATRFLINPQHNSLCTQTPGLQQGLPAIPASVHTLNPENAFGTMTDESQPTAATRLALYRLWMDWASVLARHAAVSPIYPIHTCTQPRTPHTLSDITIRCCTHPDMSSSIDPPF
jgi:hypothetical protein